MGSEATSINEGGKEMITSVSNRAYAGTITPAVVLLCLSSLAFADTWDSIDDANFSGNQYSGAKLAVAEVMFLEGDSLQEESMAFAFSISRNFWIPSGKTQLVIPTMTTSP